MYESSYLPENLDETMKLMLDKQLKPISSNKFDDLIKTAFKGETDIVFDQVLTRILMNPLGSNYFDFLLEGLIKNVDLAFAMRHKIKRNNSLQFDYSSRYHPVSNSVKVISDDINNRF